MNFMKKICRYACCLVLCLSLLLFSFSVAVHAEEQSDLIIVTDKYLYLGQEFTVEQFCSAYKTNGVTVLSADRTELSDRDRIPSGAVITETGTGISRTCIVQGDVDRNGRINSSDARHILRISARLEKIDDYVTFAACLNRAGYKINSSNARNILQYAIGKNQDQWAQNFKINRSFAPESYRVFAITLKNGYRYPEVIDLHDLLKTEDLDLFFDDDIDAEAVAPGLAYVSPGSELTVDEINELMFRLYCSPEVGEIVFPLGELLDNNKPLEMKK